MENERNQEQDDAARQRDAREQDATERHERARTSGSFEGERAAHLSLEMQTLQNRVDRLERMVAGLEDEVAGLRRVQDQAPS